MTPDDLRRALYRVADAAIDADDAIGDPDRLDAAIATVHRAVDRVDAAYAAVRDGARP